MSTDDQASGTVETGTESPASERKPSSAAGKKRRRARKPVPTHIPLHGKSRWWQIAPFVNVCHETWRKLGRDLRAPQPERISLRCTVYDNQEMHRWMADPVNYRAQIGAKRV